MGHARQTRLLLLLTVLLAGTVVMTPPHVHSSGYNHFPLSVTQRRIVEEQQRLQREHDVAGREGNALLLESEEGPAGGGPSGASASAASATASPGGAPRPRPLSLFLFVVFHEQLHDGLYRGLSIPPAEQDLVAAAEENTTTLLANHGVTFLATNPRVAKHYNTSNPLFAHRVVREWETPRYDRHCVQSRLNEFGAMRSIYCNGWSGAPRRHRAEMCRTAPASAALPPPAVAPDQLSLAPRRLFPDPNGGAVPEFVGVFEYDMAFGTPLLQLLRRRIARATAASPPTPAPAPPPRARPLMRGPRHGLTPPPPPPPPAPAHCCVFYAVTHPTAFLLRNPLGRRLLDRYNGFYNVSKSWADVRGTSVLDAFILPTATYNAMQLFLLAVEHDVTRPDGGRCLGRGLPLNETAFPSTEAAGAAAAPVEVLERAQALWLALLPRSVEFVAMPLKHKKLEAPPDPLA